MSSRHKQTPAHLLTKAEKREQKRTHRAGHKSPSAGIHDRLATDMPKGVRPVAVLVPCPSGDGSTLRVYRNVRGDTLAQMRCRGQIDEHQYEAGRMWQRFYEDAEIGGIKAMDTTKEPVDGGGQLADPLTEKVRRAVKALARADAAVGFHHIGLIRDVLGSGRTIAELAELRGMTSKADKEYLGRLFRGCLDALAVAFGLADRKLCAKGGENAICG